MSGEERDGEINGEKKREKKRERRSRKRRRRRRKRRKYIARETEREEKWKIGPRSDAKIIFGFIKDVYNWYSFEINT